MIEILLTKKTNVFEYSVSSSGITTIGDLLRKEDERGYNLDLFEDEKIPITYQIADITEPDVKTSPFSKNFFIPGTKRNQLAMGFPYMISNAKPFKVYNGEIVNGDEWHLPVQEAQIYVEGILAFTGKVELNRASIVVGEINSFEINFLATQLNIFDELENKKMINLEMPNPEITSAADVTAVYGSTGSDATFSVDGHTYNGFTFAMPDWGFQGPTAGSAYTDDGIYNTTGLNNVWRSTSTPVDPANAGLMVGYNLTFYAYIKFLIDKIFDGVDFSYASDFFNSEDFKRILLLSYNSEIAPANTGMKIFGSAPTSSSYWDDQIDNSGVGTILEEKIINLSNSGSIPGASPFNAGEGLMDPFYIWNNSEQLITFKKKGNYRINAKAIVDIRYGWDQVVDAQGSICPGAGGNNNVYPHATYPLLGFNSNVKLVRVRGAIANTESISARPLYQQSLATPSTYSKNGGTHYQWEASLDCFTTSLKFSVNAEAGDQFYFVLETDPTRYLAAPVAAGCDAMPADERKYESAIDIMALDVNKVFHNWEQTLPDISQKQFLSNLIKHYNIYTELTVNSRAIRFEPRDGFYQGGITQDWTVKADVGSMRDITRSDPPLNVYARMKKTSNVLDKEAQNINADELEYGSLKTTLLNGKEEDITIQSEFSSATPDSMKMLEELFGSNQEILSVGAKSGGGILYWHTPNPALFSVDKEGNPELTSQSESYLAYVNFFAPVIAGSAYAYAFYNIPGDPGIVDYLQDGGGIPRSNQICNISNLHPDITSGIDTNFKATSSTNNWSIGRDLPPVFEDLKGNYEEYYSTFFANLNEQRVLALKVRLNPSDIARFSFRNPIYIQFPNGDSSYFIVNKIDYDPTHPGPYNVELLTFNQIFFDYETSNSLPPDQTIPEGPSSPS